MKPLPQFILIKYFSKIFVYPKNHLTKAGTAAPVVGSGRLPLDPATSRWLQQARLERLGVICDV